MNTHHDKVGRFSTAGASSALRATTTGVNVRGVGGKLTRIETTPEGALWIEKHRIIDHSAEPGSRRNPIHCGDNLEKAQRLIAAGKHVMLAQPDEVSTLVLKIKHDVDAAKAAGSTPPVFNVADISVKGTNLFAQDNLDIPRVEMPQLGGLVARGSKAAALMTPAQQADPKAEIDLSKVFIQSLKDRGIASHTTTVKASHLRASQDEMDGAKIGGMAEAMTAGTLPDEVITVTKDNYVLDGHHRWAATIVNDLQKTHTGGHLTMKVNKLDIDIGTALSLGRAFQEEYGIAPGIMGAKKRDFSWLRHLKLAPKRG